MKKIWLAGSLLIVLIIVIFAGYIFNQLSNPKQLSSIDHETSQHLSRTADSMGSISHSISLNMTFQESPEKISLYKTIPPDVSRSLLDEYAKVFNVSGTFLEGENALSLQSEDLRYSIEIDKASGTVIYMDANRPNNALDSPDKLPSDEEAARIAMQFLKEKNLFPEGAFLRKTEREYDRSTDRNGKQFLHNGRIVVWFGRILNNLEVKGTQLSVEIGGNGDVLDYYANWREYMPFKEYALKSPETAFEELKQEGLKTGMSDPSISINNVTLAYRTKAGAYTEEYLEPIWIFSGTASEDNRTTESVSKYIPALTDEAVKSLELS